jgi:hypothetical protein
LEPVTTSPTYAAQFQNLEKKADAVVEKLRAARE